MHSLPLTLILLHVLEESRTHTHTHTLWHQSTNNRHSQNNWTLRQKMCLNSSKTHKHKQFRLNCPKKNKTNGPNLQSIFRYQQYLLFVLVTITNVNIQHIYIDMEWNASSECFRPARFTVSYKNELSGCLSTGCQG